MADEARGGADVLMSCRGGTARLPTSASKSLLLEAVTPLTRALLHRFLSLLDGKEGQHCEAVHKREKQLEHKAGRDDTAVLHRCIMNLALFT